MPLVSSSRPRSLALPLVALLAACEVGTGSAFDPLGEDVAFRTDGPWTIGGVAATEALCDAAGLATVELVFIDIDEDEIDDYEIDSDREYRYAAFRFPCADASANLDEPVLAYGTYVVRWSGVTADDEEKSVTAPFVLDASIGVDTAVAEPPAFPAPGTDPLLVALSWDQDPSDDFSAGTCDDASEISHVAYVLSSGADDELESATEDGCVESLSFDVAAGTAGAPAAYTLTVEAGPAADEIYWSAECDLSHVEGDTTARVCEVQDVRPRFTVVLQWDQTEGGAFVAGDCGDSAPVAFSFSLVDADTDDEVLAGMDLGCTNELTFEAPDVELGKGYDLLVNGGANGSSTTWEGGCAGLSATAGAGAGFNCAVERPIP